MSYFENKIFMKAMISIQEFMHINKSISYHKIHQNLNNKSKKYLKFRSCLNTTFIKSKCFDINLCVLDYCDFANNKVVLVASKLFLLYCCYINDS